MIFADLLGKTWGTLLGNGMTAGGIAAILLTAFMELTGPRRRRLEVELAVASLPKIDEFSPRLCRENRLGRSGDRGGCALPGKRPWRFWHNKLRTMQRLTGRHLILTARPAEGAVELEFLATAAGENLEDRLAYLSEQPEIIDEGEISFRLLRHYASSVRHQKYHDLDIIAVQVERTP